MQQKILSLLQFQNNTGRYFRLFAFQASYFSHFYSGSQGRRPSRPVPPSWQIAAGSVVGEAGVWNQFDFQSTTDGVSIFFQGGQGRSMFSTCFQARNRAFCRAH